MHGSYFNSYNEGKYRFRRSCWIHTERLLARTDKLAEQLLGPLCARSTCPWLPSALLLSFRADSLYRMVSLDLQALNLQS